MKIINNIPKLSKIKEKFNNIKEKIKIRREKVKSKEQKPTEFKYYALLFSMIIVGLFSLILNIQTTSDVGKESYNSYSAGEENFKKSDIDDTSEVSTTPSDILVYKEAVSSVYTDVSNNITKVDKKETKKENYVYKYSYVLPIQGKIIRDYSVDEVVYLKTIDMWKIHEGIDIKAELGDKVIAVEKGAVVDVYKTAFYGVTVEIDHGNGYTSRYCNLNEKISLKAGDKVEKGEEIAVVGNTSNGESLDEPHLHFEILKNGEYIDPKILGIKP